MIEITTNKDIKMENEVGTDGMKIIKEPEITIKGNDEDRFLLNLVKINFFEIVYFDYIIERDDPSHFVSLLEA